MSPSLDTFNLQEEPLVPSMGNKAPRLRGQALWRQNCTLYVLHCQQKAILHRSLLSLM